MPRPLRLAGLSQVTSGGWGSHCGNPASLCSEKLWELVLSPSLNKYLRRLIEAILYRQTECRVLMGVISFTSNLENQTFICQLADKDLIKNRVTFNF